jgi:hypothetical protein
VTAPVGFGGDATLAAGSIRSTFPTKTEKLLLNTGASGRTDGRRSRARNQPAADGGRQLGQCGEAAAARGGRLNLLTAQEVTDKAAEQALRASEIVRSLRQLVGRSETERRIEELSSMIEEASSLVLNSIAPLALRVMFEFDDNARYVWVKIAFDLGNSVRTVEVHRARMMERLGMRQLAEVIRLGIMARLNAPLPTDRQKARPRFD